MKLTELVKTDFEGNVDGEDAVGPFNWKEVDAAMFRPMTI